MKKALLIAATVALLAYAPAAPAVDLNWLSVNQATKQAQAEQKKTDAAMKALEAAAAKAMADTQKTQK